MMLRQGLSRQFFQKVSTKKLNSDRDGKILEPPNGSDCRRMMTSRKRRREGPPTIHPRNRYAEHPPDFALLASLYDTFRPFVFISRSTGLPTIDWTDFDATREVTRVLLLHDHCVNWWIPDGHLCPTVPNRSNYIHWIEDLLSSQLIPRPRCAPDRVRGFDIGTGANCIYPLLGASLLGWSFVGSDVTDVALEWARKNVNSNPNLSESIEIRDSRISSNSCANDLLFNETDGRVFPVLQGVVRAGEYYDFCMCNPPFFETVEDAGLNPTTSCGGTLEEMVCPGGERAFISRIIEDSVVLKQSFWWFTSMVGRKTNLKYFKSKLRKVGVSIVKTTEFVQGRTARWGLAWSFVAPSKKFLASSICKKINYSFTLEGLQRHFGAFQILKSVETFFVNNGASCESDISSFCVHVTLSHDDTETLVRNGLEDHVGVLCGSALNESKKLTHQDGELSFRISVFEQIPGVLLVRGLLPSKESRISGIFSSLFQQLEEVLRKEVVRLS